MSNDQKPYENISRVFWIKIELKENLRRGKQVIGEIKDMISGEKRVIKDLFDIIKFIIPYMKRMGIRIKWFWRFANWINGKGSS